MAPKSLVPRERMVPRGLEPWTLRLLAVRSNQLIYETTAILCKHFVFYVKFRIVELLVQEKRRSNN